MTVGRATEQPDDYPRPQLVRENWTSLDGDWAFAFDDSDVGLEQRWWSADASADHFPLSIRVPFTFEAPLSGIADTAPHRVVWYRRTLSIEHGSGNRLLLHFGAVDQSASVWVDGQLVGTHQGGQTAFSFDVTHSLAESSSHLIVVRAEDGVDTDVPRGKQEWRSDQHEIWYERATGIWKSVWCEQVASTHVQQLRWQSDVTAGTVSASITLNGEPKPGTELEITLSHGDLGLAQTRVQASDRRTEIQLELPALRNRQEARSLWWTAEHPVLIDAQISVVEGGTATDTVGSYLGLRSVDVGHRSLLINQRPCFVRAVLEQGYWTDGLWTAPSSDALREEVELILSLGFNTVRIHQKIEDARFLYWCDRLGLMVWGEIGAAYGFSPQAVENFTGEWVESVRERTSHPSLVAWVPFNESWGVNELAPSTEQRNFVRGISGLTRALDPTRPVISNDGWEHVDSDIVTIHDYAQDAAALHDRYDSPEALARVYVSMGPGEHRVLLDGQGLRNDDGELPVILSEFGGVAFAVDGTWGYGTVSDSQSFDDAVSALFAAANSARLLAGYCYTQLTDTAQEANGLLREDRTPKLPVERIRAMVLGYPTNR